MNYTIDDLMVAAKALPQIPSAAATAYRLHMQVLIKHVDNELSGLPEIHSLIGLNSLPAMFENHKHHASFMATVFSLGSYELLCRTIPWVYRSYHSHSFSYDYFPIELKAWRDGVEKYIGPALGKSIRTVYDWMIEHHEQFIHLAATALASPIVIAPDWQAVKSSFQSALIAGDHRECLSLALENIKTTSDVEALYSQAIQPAMYEIGNLWEQGKLSVAQEHLASAIVGRIMATVSMTTINSNRTKGKAVVTASPNEFHEIGAWMVSDILEAEGWDVTYLGANTPQIDLIQFLLSNRPRLLAISITMPFNLETAKDTIEAIRKLAVLDDMKILVGGAVLNANPQLRGVLGADGFASSIGEAKGFSRQWEKKQLNGV